MMLDRRHALGLLAGAPFVIGAHKKATAFALIGDRYHNSDYIRTGLGRTIAKESGISIDFCDEVKMLNADTLNGYKMLIIQRDGMLWPDGYPDERTNAAWVATGLPQLVSSPEVPKTAAKPVMWMTDDQGKAVKEFVQNGGNALFLHNVTHVGLSNKDFRDVLGAAYTGHPPIRKFKVKVTNPDHPIAPGVKDFIVTDEQHYMDFDKDRKNIFLESVNEEGLDYNRQGATAPAGWSHMYGKGRVCYMSPGHLLRALWNPEYIKLQHNAIRWLTGKA
jgi:type 1 glutamine amidotransferase